jgi:carboxyl-terminal processing protease
MKKMNIRYKAIFFWLLVGAGMGWTANALVDGKLTIDDYVSSSTEEADMSLFWNVWDTLNESYVNTDKLDQQKQVYGAIAGMVEALDDPYTVFMTPDETESFHQSLGGELEGIGAELTQEEGILTVVSPLKGSPAEAAGLQPGDIVYMVDGELTSDMTLFDAITAIRGESGTNVELTILRKGENEAIIMTITRGTIDVPSVESEVVTQGDKKISVISMYQFGDNTLEAFRNSAREAVLENVDGIILDLRLNGGGYLDVSVEVLSEFFEEEQKAVIVKRRNDDNQIVYTAGNGQLSAIPLVVLVNEGSASASEIVAGAIQDYKRGVLIGTKTFGKGSVQELANLEDGASIRMTVAKWYTPNDRSIDHEGITPDTIVEMESSEIGEETDVQMQSALEYLSNL